MIKGAGTAAAAVLASLARPVLAKRKKAKRPPPLFEDNFRRTRNNGWGRSWFNQRYGRRSAVEGGRGTYRLPPKENNVYYRPNPVLVLDHDVGNVDLRTTIVTSNNTGRAGLVARAIGYADYYAAYLGPGQALRLSRCSHQDERVFAKGKAEFLPGRRYHLRLQVKGFDPVNLRAKAWPDGTKEPRRWTVVATDATARALKGRGPFGMFFSHARDGRGASFRVYRFVARSGQKKTSSAASVTFQFAAVPGKNRVRVLAKAAVPAAIGFEYGLDPLLSQGVSVIPARRATNRALTVRTSLDLTGIPPGTPVHWRPFTVRRGVKTYGRTASFSTAPLTGLPVRFAFGSCTRWPNSPRKSFEQARAQLPDFYVHEGDFGYADHRVASHAPDTYQDHWTRMFLDAHTSKMLEEVPFVALRDDHDYGVNNATLKNRRGWTIGAHGEMHANPGNRYFDFRYGGIAFFAIDCRRYSTGTQVAGAKRSKLGTQQKRWLKNAMRKAAEDDDVSLLVVLSPQAMGSDRTPASWHRSYNHEWKELIDFYLGLRAPVLVCSGDAHGHRLHEFPHKNVEPHLPRVIEINSSGTEQNKFSDGADENILVYRAEGSGFGMVEIGPEEHLAGQRVRTLRLTASKTEDGSPFWRRDYAIVRGLGIFPVGL